MRDSRNAGEDSFGPEDVERRRQIWDAVIKCIIEGGIEGTTIRKVADMVGGSTGMITHYFQNKKELITESITAMTERSIGKVNESVGVEYSPDRMGAVADLYLKNPSGDLAPINFWFSVWAEAMRDPELQQVVEQNFLRTREILSQSVAAGIESGKLRSDVDPYLISDAITSLIVGLRIRMALVPGIINSDRAYQIAELLLGVFADGTGEDAKKPAKKSARKAANRD